MKARLQQVALAMGKSAEELVRDLVSERLQYDDWFQQQVQRGAASLDHGDFLSHDEVGLRLQRLLP